MFKNGPDRTGRTDLAGPRTGIPAWKHLLKHLGIQSPQAIGHDGTIYSGSVHGVFYAFRPDGSIKWKRGLGKFEITAGPAIADDGTIYVSPENGDLYAFDEQGSVKWTFDLDGYGGPSASPAIGQDGAIYVGATKLYAINPDGTQRWIYDPGSYVAGPPAIAQDGTIYFPSGDYLYALAADGSLKWRSAGQAEYPLGSAPAIGKDGTIYVNTNDGVLHAFRSDGSLAWIYKTPGVVMDVPSSPAIAGDGTIYFGGAGEYQDRGGYFYALNADGTLKWKFFAGCDQTAVSVDKDGTIYFGSDWCGAVHALRPDGSQKWVFSNVFDYARSAPVIGHGKRLYFGLLGGLGGPDKGGLVAIGQ